MSRRYDLRTDFAPSPGDVLVHPEACFGALGDVARERFSVRRFVDLCGAIETCVLNERVVSVMTEDQGRALVRDNAFAYEIIAQDFVVLPRVTVSPERVLAIANEAWEGMDASRADVISPDDHEEFHRVGAISSALEAVVWEEVLGVPLIPTVQQAATYVDKRGLAYRHWLYVKYAEARGRAFGSRLTEDPVSHLPVPPIALMVLRSCEEAEEIPSRLLAARRRFERLRKIASELDHLSRSRSASPATKRRDRERLEGYWRKEVNTVLGDYKAETVFGIHAATERVEEFEKIAAGGGPTSPQFWLNILKAGARTSDWLKRAPFRPLGGAIRTSLQNSAEDLDGIVQRLFRYELTDEDRRRAIGLTQSLETSLARQIAQLRQHEP